MPTEPEPLTLAHAVRRAVEACDPDGTDADLSRLLEAFEDADEPIAGAVGLEARLAEARGRIAADDDAPALETAVAIVTYLAHRRDEADVEPHRLLTLAARAGVARWLEERGVSA